MIRFIAVILTTVGLLAACSTTTPAPMSPTTASDGPGSGAKAPAR